MEVQRYQGNQAPQATRSRVVVVEHVYCQQHGEEPIKVEATHSHMLATTEQPYLRKVTIGPQWTPLDSGWLTRASLLVISNDEGKNLQVVPEEFEALEIASRIVEVACVPVFAEFKVKNRDMHSPEVILPALVADWLIPPKQSIRVIPADLSRIRLRCQNGSARCTVSLFPL